MNCTGIIAFLCVINAVFLIILLRRFGILGYNKAKEAVYKEVYNSEVLPIISDPQVVDRLDEGTLSEAADMSLAYSRVVADPTLKDKLQTVGKKMKNKAKTKRDYTNTMANNSVTSWAGVKHTPSLQLKRRS